jgi:hypothetical protein
VDVILFPLHFTAYATKALSIGRGLGQIKKGAPFEGALSEANSTETSELRLCR